MTLNDCVRQAFSELGLSESEINSRMEKANIFPKCQEMASQDVELHFGKTPRDLIDGLKAQFTQMWSMTPVGQRTAEAKSYQELGEIEQVSSRN